VIQAPRTHNVNELQTARMVALQQNLLEVA